MTKESLIDLKNRIEQSGIVDSHGKGNLMNMNNNYFHNRLITYFPDWSDFLKKHGARFVGFVGHYVICDLLKIPFEIKLKGDDGKDIFHNDKWWDVKTGFSSSAGIPANTIRHPETYGYIFCYYSPSDRLVILQTNTVEEVWRPQNFKAKGTALKWRDVAFDCYMPPDKFKQNIDEFLGLIS
jgi:hypothetical protein